MLLFKEGVGEMLCLAGLCVQYKWLKSLYMYTLRNATVSVQAISRKALGHCAAIQTVNILAADSAARLNSVVHNSCISYDTESTRKMTKYKLAAPIAQSLNQVFTSHDLLLGNKYM